MHQDSRKIEYDGVAKALHWIIAILVILLLSLGGNMEDLPVVDKTEAVMGHSGLGTIILILMFGRLAWRLKHSPPVPSAMSAWQIKASAIVHFAFYTMVILQPLFGIVQAAFIDYPVLAFGVIDYSALATNNETTARIFHIAHSLSGKLILLLIVVHAGAALVHHFFQKDMVLRRMLPRYR